MPAPQPETDLAHIVARCAGRSVHLITGLRGALVEIGRHDLVMVLDLVEQDAREARAAGAEVLATRRRQRRLRVILGLQQLTRLGGPKIRRLATRLAHDMDSGAHKIYPARRILGA